MADGEGHIDRDPAIQYSEMEEGSSNGCRIEHQGSERNGSGWENQGIDRVIDVRLP